MLVVMSPEREPTRRKTKRWERGGRDRVPDILQRWSRRVFATTSVFLVIGVGILTWFWSPGIWFFIPVVLFVGTGVGDVLQRSHTVLRNFPVVGHLRYILESLRPELRQYFVESDDEENPYSRENRSVIYQRAKGALDTIPFGTRDNVYAAGYEWVGHSISPQHVDPAGARVLIGEASGATPYSASLLNISAMSFGALSKNAVLALNTGARQEKFYHNTGEGGISPYHCRGGDLVWQIGTGYFGCRTTDGTFSPERFRENAGLAEVKMIEIKLSQGAKPAHGGILPGAKVTPEIAKIRGVLEGKDVLSPPYHRAFSSPIGLLEFIGKLRELSKKPVGFKLCVGQPAEFLSICKAMAETGILPDFITVDGSEGGTGAAPLEFSDSVGMPLDEGLRWVHNGLVGIGRRSDVRIISAGKIATGFHIVRQLALGADLCNSARGMMFALGCIQALKCNTNHCPTGVATQDMALMRGLDVADKAERVASFHQRTVDAVLELVGAVGLRTPRELDLCHIWRRVNVTEVRNLAEIYPALAAGQLLKGNVPDWFRPAWQSASSGSF